MADIDPEQAATNGRKALANASPDQLARALESVTEDSVYTPSEEGSAENIAELAAAGKKPTRLRIGALAADRQDAVRALADPNTPPEEVARLLTRFRPLSPR